MRYLGAFLRRLTGLARAWEEGRGKGVGIARGYLITANTSLKLGPQRGGKSTRPGGIVRGINKGGDEPLFRQSEKLRGVNVAEPDSRRQEKMGYPKRY